MTAMHRQGLAAAGVDVERPWRAVRAVRRADRGASSGLGHGPDHTTERREGREGRLAPATAPAATGAIGTRRPTADTAGGAGARAGAEAGAAEASGVGAGSLRLGADELEHLRETLPDLSVREFEVLIELCGGGRNDQVAKRLCIALPTLRTHLSRLNDKLGTLSKSELVAHVAAQVLRGYREGSLASAAGGGPA